MKLHHCPYITQLNLQHILWTICHFSLIRPELRILKVCSCRSSQTKEVICEVCKTSHFFVCDMQKPAEIFDRRARPEQALKKIGPPKPYFFAIRAVFGLHRSLRNYQVFLSRFMTIHPLHQGNLTWNIQHLILQQVSVNVL